jgi:hypothetical protein
MNNQEGTAGVMVSATNERDVKLVQATENLLRLNTNLKPISK